MSITQTFYNNLAAHYDKLFLDCACGIGTQSIGIAMLGYDVTASDISDGELVEAEKRAKENNVKIGFKQADFCALSDTFTEKFDIVIAMDNALPHMLLSSDLEKRLRVL